MPARTWLPLRLPQRLLFWSALPIVAAQGLALRRRAPRFAGADGEPSGRAQPANAGQDAPLRLLALGDSIVAGVGAGEMRFALAGATACALAALSGRAVQWRACGQIGIDAAGLRRRMLQELPTGEADLILVSVGVNDVTALTPRARFAAELGGLLQGLRQRHPQAWILLPGLPPLERFPLLPAPLRQLMGLRARLLEEAAREVAASAPRVLALALPFQPGPEAFAGDGFHPNADSYRQIGELLAQAAWVRLRS